jgi:hypothetical protein
MITVLFTVSKSPLSKLIRWVTGEKFSHCGVLLGSGHVIHINLLGLQIQKLESFESHNTIMDSVEISTPVPVNPLDLLLGEGRTGYDYKAFILLGLGAILPKRWLPRSIQVPGMYICSEFVYNILEHTELSRPKTPGELHEFLLNRRI